MKKRMRLVAFLGALVMILSATSACTDATYDDASSPASESEGSTTSSTASSTTSSTASDTTSSTQTVSKIEQMIQSDLDYIEENYETKYAAAIRNNDHSDKYYGEVASHLEYLYFEFDDPSTLTPAQTKDVFFAIETFFEPERRACWPRLQGDSGTVFPYEYVRDILMTYLDCDMSAQIRALPSAHGVYHGVYDADKDAWVFRGDTFSTYGSTFETYELLSVTREGDIVTIKQRCIGTDIDMPEIYNERISTYTLREEGQRFVLLSIARDPSWNEYHAQLEAEESAKD